MTIDELEHRISRNNRSPLFARLADELFRAKRVDKALTICTQGLTRYPEYVTAHLVAARCYAQQKQYEKALQHIEIVIKSLPNNRILLSFRNNWREILRINTKAGGPAASTATRRKGEERTSKPFLAERTPIIKENLVTDPVDFAASDTGLEDNPIVSVTLAEIYATQGAYEAAIAMYRKLKQQKPKQAEKFEMKIRELQEKIRQRST